MRFFITLLLLVFAGTHPAFGVEAVFKSEVQVTDSFVTLGDIASFDTNNPSIQVLATQQIGQSPSPGKAVTFEGQAVLRQLASQGLLPPDIRWSGANNISITRAGVTIEPAKLQEIIDEFLLSQQDILPDAEIQFIPDELPPPFMLAPGEISWEVLPSKPGILGSSRFSIIFKVDDRVSKNLSLRGKLKALTPVAVATAHLSKNDVINQGSVTMEVQDISDIKDPILSLEQLIGKRVTRNIRNGAVIDASQLENIPLVHRGERVKILFTSGTLRLTATGIARSNGGLHEIIRVQNTSSNKIIQCQVTAPGTVEVNL